jgi:hypothetical protein
VRLYEKGVFAPNFQTRFGKQRKIEVDQLKSLLQDFSRNVVLLGVERKYRRLVVRWERQSVYFNSFIDLATIHIWIQRVLLVG